MKTDVFQSCGHCWVFQICWHIECSTFTAASFRIWNSSTGIPSPLALFVVMLLKAHLTSHSRMSGSRWVITPSWLSRSWRSFLYSSSVYSCHLFLISSTSVRSIPFLSFIEPIFAWNVRLVALIFLKRSLVFPILLFSVADFILGGSKITTDGDWSHEIKRRLLLERKVMTKLDSILKKQRHYFANKSPCCQSYDFSISHVCMWELGL